MKKKTNISTICCLEIFGKNYNVELYHQKEDDPKEMRNILDNITMAMYLTKADNIKKMKDLIREIKCPYLIEVTTVKI
ncbi:hypothetical protein RRV45_01170 [Bacillus sp. DTU_2020_1000418_1_SI_GHA_SEK_038]|uniref:hypothetical protein n=1 Tax=Bacillus sp. DTU_2020_1000418_1_SI_GHA_SEK_038 TaxID=3077585 RepID=UPI0028ECD471|nr:hypothetical protein [Bacillus sp. DTU_2020_1000418_1_SI_GHA_SEK_038]WNS75690.1 hypothetical protein RRV45_01170 [Bacillus sp. DTU_2020_1000418_1_SI_GHA_SEK_038]